MKFKVASIIFSIFILIFLACGSSDSALFDPTPAPPPPTEPTQYFGVDYLGIQHERFPCQLALEVFDGVKAPALGLLWESFGTSNGCIVKFLDQNKDKHHFVRVHLSNGHCVRHGVCGPWEARDDIQEIVKNAREAIAFFDAAGNDLTHLAFSPQLEDNWDKWEAYPYREALGPLSVWPLVRNSVENVIDSNYDIQEHHRGRPEFGGIYSLDGVKLEDFNPGYVNWAIINARSEGYLATFLWHPSLNGVSRDASESFILPRDRHFSIPVEVLDLFAEKLANT